MMALLRLLLCIAAAVPFCSGFSSSASSNAGGSAVTASTRINNCPEISPATGLKNQFYTWKENQQIRYQCAGPEHGEPVVLVHGLFVNSDHWRKTIKALADEGYRTYALDLWGCGYSDKPPASSEVARRVCGELSRFTDATNNPAILANVQLGSKCGKKVRIRNVELRHPLQSPYNFFTWANLINDFTKDVVLQSPPSQTVSSDFSHKDVTLVSNSIGTISALQAVLDQPDLHKGVFVVSPNFRELHSAEVPFAQAFMPFLRTIQRLLRENGQSVFDALAKPNTVKQILSTPYKVTTAVDDTLVQVLLDPLLTEGASKVVFDILSYSAGPLPEQQLNLLSALQSDNNSDNVSKPVWICYGDADPWTPGPRVEALKRFGAVQKVISLPGAGHCPQDETPELVHPLLLDFLSSLKDKSSSSVSQEHEIDAKQKI